MELLDKMKNRQFEVLCAQPIVYCKVFEDESNLDLAHLPELHHKRNTVIYAIIFLGAYTIRTNEDPPHRHRESVC